MIFGEENSEPMGNQPQQPSGQQQIRVDLSQMETVYANFFAITGAADEVVFYLGANSPMPQVPQPIVRVSHRLMMVPSNAKRLMLALQQTIKAHEDRFGPIEVAPPHRPPNPS